ncbi:Tetratricopeptide repeat protein 17 [Nymphon striatum]|nr:Tetratricopeptide repeat protein 17 [Nymphon striatum]
MDYTALLTGLSLKMGKYNNSIEFVESTSNIQHLLYKCSKQQATLQQATFLLEAEGIQQMCPACTNMDSVFVMKRPYDLVSLMQQEKRSDLVESLKQELYVQKEQIDKNEDKETNLEENVYKTNPHCILAEGKQLGEFSLYSGAFISMKERNLDDEVPNKYEEPVCTTFSKLDFSMFSYDHLNSIKDRKNLTMPKDSSLLEAVLDLNIPSFGHYIHESLSKNKTSWIYYNIAAYFWRMQGQADNAVECLRRALHFVPKEYRDLCLFNLANILHMAHQSEEAAIIMHNAIDMQSNVAVYHYVLGTIYAVLADYNTSLICFDNALKLKPNFSEAKLLKNAILCHSQLEKALESQHDSLQRTLGELKELQKHQEQLFYQQEKLKAEQATFSTKIEQRLQYEEQKLREAFEARGKTKIRTCQLDSVDSECVDVGSVMLKMTWKINPAENGQAVVSCSIDSEASKIKSAEIHILHGIIEEENSPNESVIGKMESNKVDSVLSMSLTEDFPKQNIPKNATPENIQPPSSSHIYPRKFSKEEQVKRSYYQDPTWPSQEECNKTVTAFPPADEFPSVYMSPENKGFNVHDILTSLQGLGPVSTHALPWYPPFCDNLDDDDDSNSNIFQWMNNQLPSLKDEPKIKSVTLPDNDIRDQLLAYIGSANDIAEEEIGQRIMTAISKSLAPNWVLCTIAALYWRVQGNIVNAITCLKKSLVTTPENLIDVPLVSLASILFRLKEFDDAIAVMHKAMSVNSVEPISNFFLANLYAITGNFSGAVHHYKRALNVEPSNSKIVEYAKIVTCYLKVHLKNRMNKITQMQQSIIQDETMSVNVATEFVKTVKQPPETAPRPEEHVTSSDVQVQVKVNVGSQTVNHVDHIPNLSNDIETIFIDSANVNIPDDTLPQFLVKPNAKPVYIAIPTKRECDALLKDTNLKQLTSTWLSVSAKNIIISDHLKVTNIPDTNDIGSSQKVGKSLPHCSSEFPVSMLTLDHLSGVKNRLKLQGSSEMGLRDAFLSLWGDLQRNYLEKTEKAIGTEKSVNFNIIMDSLGHHLANAIKKNTTSWVLTTISALYWRITGDAAEAVNCLRHALHFAPRHMRDIPLVSLANVLHRAGLHNDAIITTNMALEISPRFVVIHFTMANIYAAKGDFLLAKVFYESTLSLQATFEPARERLNAILCGHSHFLTHSPQTISQGNLEH